MTVALEAASWDLLSRLFPEMAILGYTARVTNDVIVGIRPDGTVWISIARADQSDPLKFDDLVALLRRSGKMGN
jgi:hypothetical protein